MLDYPYQLSVVGENEIRLLNLRSGDTQEELVGSLEVIQLKSESEPEAPVLHRRYDTLSYTWGDQDPTKHIKIIHGNQQYRIRIRPNLHQALLHLRYNHEDRYLWVDAICIHQNDEQEKSSQVRMMSEIFGNSRCVCVWVGPDKDQSRLAIDFIKSRLVQDDAYQLLKQAEYRHEWIALSNLMRRPWFSRRWIIQEIALAKTATLHCGSDWLPWEIFAEAVMLFTWGQAEVCNMLRTAGDCTASSLGDLRESAAARLIHAQDNIFRKSKDGQLLEKLMTLEDLLCRFSASEAQNPRDSIYALLSIARDANAGFSDSTTYLDGLQDNIGRNGYGHSSPQDFAGREPENLSPLRLTMPEELNMMSEHDGPDVNSRKRAGSNTEPYGGTSRRPSKQIRSVSSQLPPSSWPNDRGVVEDRAPAIAPAIRFESIFQEDPDRFQVSPSAMSSQDSGPGPDEHNSPPPPLRDHQSTSAPAPPSASRDDGLLSITWGGNRRATTGSTDRSVNDQRLPVPGRARGNSSGSLKSNLTENYFMESEANREKQAQEHSIHVDYSKSVSEVCKDAMNYAFVKTKSLNMMCRPWAPRMSPAEMALPTWIQPVSKSAFGPAHNGTYTRINADPLVGRPGPGQCFYNATPYASARCKISDDGTNTLTVYGFVLDEIYRKAPPANGGVIPVEWIELAEWIETSCSPPPDAFWRTLVGNRDNAGQQPLKLWRRACQMAFGMKPRDGPLDVERALEEASSFVREYLEKVLRTTYSRRLSIGLAGLWALVPAKSKKGDKLCIINGCSVPVVLRQRKNLPMAPRNTLVNGDAAVKCSQIECQAAGRCKCKTSNTGSDEPIYEMIGECYVHGMMDGEALLYQQKKDIKTRTFQIR